MATMLGGLLVDDGALTATEVDAALEEQRETRERLGSILLRRGLDPEALARALGRQLRLAYAPPPLMPEPEALELVPRGLALRLRVLPLTADRRTVRVAMVDPLDAGAVDDLRFRTGRRVEPVVASGDAVDRALIVAYGEEAVRAVLRRLPLADPGGGPGTDGTGAGSGASPGPPVHMVGMGRAAPAGSVGLRCRNSAPVTCARSLQHPPLAAWSHTVS